MAKPFFFLHIPRTAGTTLNAVIKNNFDDAHVLSIYNESDYTRLATLHAEDLEPIRLIQGHLFLEKYDPPTSYSREVEVFTFLRDPVKRLVSEYLFQRHWNENSLYALLNNEGISFREYVGSTRKELRFRGKNFMTRMISGMDFDLDSYPCKALDVAKHNLENVFGFVGIQERFDESLVLLQVFLGLESVLYEKRNVLRPALKESISGHDLEFAREKNAADVELFSFAQELFESRVRGLGDVFRAKVERFCSLNVRYAKLCRLVSEQKGVDRDVDVLLPKDDTTY